MSYPPPPPPPSPPPPPPSWQPEPAAPVPVKLGWNSLPSDPLPAPPGVRWGFRHGLASLGIGIAAAFLAAVVLYGVTGEEPTTAQLFGFVAGAQAIGTLLAALFFARRLGSGDPRLDLGLTFAAKDLLGIPLGFGLQVAIGLMLAPIFELFDIDQAPQEAIRRTSEASDATTVIAALLAIGILAPISEEVLFRGMILRSLRRKYRRWPAILLSAGIFAVIHLLDPSAYLVVLPLFGVGVVLAVLTEARRSIGMAIWTHIGFNMTVVLALVLVPAS